MPAACREPLRQNIRYSADDVTPLTLRASASANELLVVASAKQAEVKARDEDIESEVKKAARTSPR
jgi:hypothetical protein